MNRKLRPGLALVIAIATLSIAIVTRLSATAEYEYKPGEYLVAKDGLSPNKQFAIVCGDNKFGVYLMDAKTKELLGELEGVAKGLDYGARGLSRALVSRFKTRRHLFARRTTLCHERDLPD